MPANPTSATLFHKLHAGPDVLILPNAWDAASARLTQEVGVKAIATSSAAVAWAHGYADGHGLPIEKLVTTVTEIARVVSVPISVDSEAGYSDDAAGVGKNIAALIDAGGVGINLEDGHEAHELHLKKIEAARSAAERAGVKLYINARTDVFLKKLVPAEQAVEESIRRGRAFIEAGASGLFVPAATDPKDIEAIVKGVDLPLNVIATPATPNAAALKALGVRRLSAGTRLFNAAMEAARQATEAYLRDGNSAALGKAGGVPPAWNDMFKA